MNLLHPTIVETPVFLVFFQIWILEIVKYRCNHHHTKPDAIDAKDLEGIFDAAVEFQRDFKRKETREVDDVRSDRSQGGWKGKEEEEKSMSYPRFRRYLRVSVLRSNGCRTAGFTTRGQHICWIRNVSSGPGALLLAYTQIDGWRWLLGEERRWRLMGVNSR